MENWLFLATESAEELSERGFGFNFDIFESNLINLLIIIVALIYFGRNFLGNILKTRQQKIAGVISEAEQKVKSAAAALAEAQQNLAQAQAKAEQIRQEAQRNAEAVGAAIAQKAAADVAKLRETAGRDLDTARERAIAELRERLANLSMAQVQAYLQSQLSESDRQKILEQSISRLGGKSA